MTQWIQSSNTKQDGSPVTRNIKIPEMSNEIWFTTNAYAEVSDDVADLLANQFASITKVSEPAEPGTYYGDAGENTTVKLVLADKAFDSFTAEQGDIDVLDSESVSTEVLDNVFTIVTDTQELKDALNNLSAGETVHVANGTYDIDGPDVLLVDTLGVDIVFESTTGVVLKAVTDDARGFRVTADRVTIGGHTYDGNRANLDAPLNRRHGFIVDGASYVALDDAIIKNTAPRAHGTGGSGATVRQGSSNVVISNVEFDNVGDRCTQGAGTNVRVIGCEGDNGYDRFGTTEYHDPDGNYYTGRAWEFRDNFVKDISAGGGSAFGLISGAQNSDRGYHVVADNRVVGTHDSLIKLTGSQHVTNPNNLNDCLIEGNVGKHDGTISNSDGISIGPQARGVTISGGILDGYTKNGIGIHSNNTDIDVTVDGVTIRNVGQHGWYVDEGHGITATGLTIQSPAGDGVNDPQKHNTYGDITVLNAGGDAVNFSGSDISASTIVIRGGTRGFVSSAGGSSFSTIQATDTDDEGVVMQSVGHDSQLSTVVVEDADQSGTGSAHVQINDSNLKVRGITCYGSGGGVVEDSAAADNSFKDVDLAQTSAGTTYAGTRTRVEGTIELGEAPSGSNYDADDAGVDILDTSVSPPDVYYVLRDGTLTGAT